METVARWWVPTARWRFTTRAGSEWERYAMIKARPVTGSQAARASLMAMVDAFVYRRYTDFSGLPRFAR